MTADGIVGNGQAILSNIDSVFDAGTTPDRV